MFSRVLVATDLSHASESVLHCVKGLAPLGTKNAILVHAIGIQPLEAMTHGMDELLEPAMAAQKEILDAEGFETEVVIATGPAVVEVNRIARERQASLNVAPRAGYPATCFLPGTSPRRI